MRSYGESGPKRECESSRNQGPWQLAVAGVDGLAEDAELVDASYVVFTTGLALLLFS